MMQYESHSPTLRPLHEFLLSIALIFVVILSIFVIYYNAFLAYRGKPPYTVIRICPQFLFPRGIEGLGRYNFEEEGFEQELLQ